MSKTLQADRQVVPLLKSAEEAWRAGQCKKATRILNRVLEIQPEHPLALTLLGNATLDTGNLTAARGYFERAVRADPNLAAAWLQLSAVCRAQGDLPAETEALAKTLTLEPGSIDALLRMADLLERAGRVRYASRLYADALTLTADRTELPPALQRALRHAREVVESNNAALERYLLERMSALRSPPANASLRRINASLDILLGKQRFFTQEPSFLAIPFLPPIPFFDRADFPWLDEMEAAVPDIRAELQALLTDGEEFAPYIDHPDKLPMHETHRWAALNRSSRWGTYYFWRDGEPVKAHCERCPRTASVLAAAPLARIPQFAPTALFSILRPKTRIPPHTGMTNARLIVHLPLKIPEGCALRVGSETHVWQEGRAVIFDDTIEHEAWNDSNETRVVLLFDIWHPALSDAERELVSAMIEGYRAYYREAAAQT